jgi:hypothetical protein
MAVGEATGKATGDGETDLGSPTSEVISPPPSTKEIHRRFL